MWGISTNEWLCLSVCLSIWLTVCLSVCLPFYLSVFLSVCLSVSQSVSQSVCLSVSVCVWLCLSVSVCVWLSVFCIRISSLIELVNNFSRQLMLHFRAFYNHLLESNSLEQDGINNPLLIIIITKKLRSFIEFQLANCLIFFFYCMTTDTPIFLNVV